MSNQLERFQGLSETRWPLPSGLSSSSGENRKALSRYINEYIAELEQSDEEMRRTRSSEPSKHWKRPDTKESDHQTGMSRSEYIRRQNALFRELTGYKSWSEMSAHQAAQDQQDQPLMNSLELYMAALDEKIYMSADHLRAMIGIRDKEVRDHYEKLREQGGVTLRDLVELRDKYQLLWFEHSDLSHQRDQLEVEMSQLRYDHALQATKVVRLQYAVHALGRKLVDAQQHEREANSARDECAELRRENAELRAQNEALRVQDESNRAIFNKASDATDTKTKSVEERISLLFDVALNLRAANAYSPPPEHKNALDLLKEATNLIDLAKLDVDARLSAIIEAFNTQYRAREQELLTQIATLEREKQILRARCEKYEVENSTISSDLAYLEQRTLSLVLMLKSLRATLEGPSSSEAPPQQEAEPELGGLSEGTQVEEAQTPGSWDLDGQSPHEDVIKQMQKMFNQAMSLPDPSTQKRKKKRV